MPVPLAIGEARSSGPRVGWAGGRDYPAGGGAPALERASLVPDAVQRSGLPGIRLSELKRRRGRRSSGGFPT